MKMTTKLNEIFKKIQGLFSVQKSKENNVAAALAVMKQQEAKKVLNPLFEKGPKNFGTGEDFQPKKPPPTLGNDPAISGCSGKELSSISD